MRCADENNSQDPYLPFCDTGDIDFPATSGQFRQDIAVDTQAYGRRFINHSKDHERLWSSDGRFAEGLEADRSWHLGHGAGNQVHQGVTQ